MCVRTDDVIFSNSRLTRSLLFAKKKMTNNKKRSAERVEEALAKFKRTLDNLKNTSDPITASVRRTPWNSS